ncbi:MAG: hypothetical protein JXB85_03990 [Anaerolineales bacterium]|nr:hypothetical protein [Anaerolineales bacterium]
MAATLQMMEPQPASETPITPPLPPTAIPAQVLPPGTFLPYADNLCEGMRSSFEQAIGAPVMVESAPFSDRMTGGSGTACRIHAAGNGTAYSMSGPFNTLHALVLSLGWTEDFNYSAAGATGMASGYRKGSALGLLTVAWQPSADANCPTDQPIGACDLTPEQKLFDVTFDLAQVVVYVPLPDAQCTAWLAALQPAVPVPLVLETVYFNDLESNFGTACQVRGEGTGREFNNPVESADALNAILAPLGWTLVNGADGPTGTAREYAYQNLTAVVTVGWQPSADADCPTDQPITACDLAPEQKLYSLTVDFAQR